MRRYRTAETPTSPFPVQPLPTRDSPLVASPQAPSFPPANQPPFTWPSHPRWPVLSPAASVSPATLRIRQLLSLCLAPASLLHLPPWPSLRPPTVLPFPEPSPLPAPL